MDRLSYAQRHSRMMVLTTEHCCEENAVNGYLCWDKKKGPEATTMVTERVSQRQKSNKFDKNKNKQLQQLCAFVTLFGKFLSLHYTLRREIW